MEQLIKNTYKLLNPDISKLKELGFRYDNKISNQEHPVYYYRFPVHKYKKYTVLECELLVDTSNGNIDLNLYDEKNNIYYPFYYNDYGDYSPLLKLVNKNIKKQLNKIGIQKVRKNCR
jgi:hypothetical protein